MNLLPKLLIAVVFAMCVSTISAQSNQHNSEQPYGVISQEDTLQTRQVMPSADAVADGYEAVQRPKVRNDLQGPSLRKSSNTTRTAPELRWTEAEPFQQVDAEKAYQSVQLSLIHI